MFTIDGSLWPVPCKIERTAEMTASEISGMLLDKSYFNDVLGTWMRYDISIAVPQDMTAAYAAIYEKLTEPVDAHSFVLPYNNGDITITGRVTEVKDTHYRVGDSGHYWAGTTFTVIANHPTKTMTLDEVITRGASPLPEASSVNIGAVYQYSSGGWTELDDADEMYW